MNREQALRRAKRYEKKYLNSVYSALNRQVLSYISAVRDYGAAYAKRLQVDPTPVERALKAHFKDVAISEANWTYTDLKTVKRASIGVNEEWVKEVKAYLDKYLLNKAVLPISEYSRQRILEVLQQGIDEGLGSREIIAKLKGLEDVNKLRAMRIVRTETTRASNFGHMMGVNTSEYYYTKEWIAVDDARTRRTHRHGSGVDGEKVGFEQPFSNGLMYPGDPNGGASETVNCRCTVGFRVKRDANGKPMRKPVKPTYLRPRLVDILWQGFATGLVQGLVNDLMNTE